MSAELQSTFDKSDFRPVVDKVVEILCVRS